MLVRYVVAVVLLALGCSACGGPGDGAVAGPAQGPSPDAHYRPPAGAVLAVPVSKEHVEDNAILKVLLTNIANTPAGALIRIVACSLSLMPVADALVEAHRRGVRVEIIAAGRISRDFKAVGELTDELGDDRRASSYLYLVDGSARGGTSALHQKTWAFSRTGAARRVVMVGSTNLSYTSMAEYNDMYSFVGRDDIWNAFAQVYADQVRDRPLAHPAVTDHLGNDIAWFYPGFTVATDPVRRYLSALPSRDLRIRVAMLAWRGERGVLIARTLADKARAGAHVEVVVSKLSATSRRVLEGAGIRVWLTEPHGFTVHHKLMLVSWTGSGGRPVHRVVTGSDNFGTPALNRDEVEMVIDPTARGSWRAYIDHFEAVLRRVGAR